MSLNGVYITEILSSSVVTGVTVKAYQSIVVNALSLSATFSIRWANGKGVLQGGARDIWPLLAI